MRTFKMPNILANQWTSLWEDHTLNEKIERDGQISKYCTGGQILHINIDANVTSSQAKTLIKKAISKGLEHFSLNSVYIECKECGNVHKGNLNICPDCGSNKLDKFSRVIGYFSKIANWNKTRREEDFPNRKFATNEQLCEELGK